MLLLNPNKFPDFDMVTFRHKKDSSIMLKGFQVIGNPVFDMCNQIKLNTLLGDERGEFSVRAIVDDKFDITDIRKNEHEFFLHVENRMKCLVRDGDWVIRDWYGEFCIMTTEQIDREFEKTNDEYRFYFTGETAKT